MTRLLKGRFRFVLAGLAILMVMWGCTPDKGGDSPATSATGSLGARVIWPNGSDQGMVAPQSAGLTPLATGNPLPTNVVNFRLTASDAGSSFAPISQTFAATDRSGTLTWIPAVGVSVSW